VCQQYHTRRRPQIRNKDFAQNKTKNIVNTIEIVNFKILPAAYQLRRQPAGHAAASADADGAAKAALRRVQPAAAAAVEQRSRAATTTLATALASPRRRPARSPGWVATRLLQPRRHTARPTTMPLCCSINFQLRVKMVGNVGKTLLPFLRV
jgi:hypothetical protein